MKKSHFISIIFSAVLLLFGIAGNVSAVVTTSGNFPTVNNDFQDGDLINSGDWNNIEHSLRPLTFGFVGSTSLQIGTTATNTISSISTSTFITGIQSTLLNITSTTATSTFANGIQLSGGCYKDSTGSCITSSSGTGTINTGARHSPPVS